MEIQGDAGAKKGTSSVAGQRGPLSTTCLLSGYSNSLVVAKRHCLEVRII
jgi:hypothetical protein